MRTLIVCVLLAFLAISFVQARPSEEESDVLDSTSENNVVDDSETTNADETDEEGDEVGEEEGDADEDDDEEEESTSTTTTEAPKHKKIFWPRFGGHGPVVIHPRFKAVA
ncbi:uncharacterized protein [Drosophila tropicalis]|uniref:uncharacterized protein n=1 Tax=Drosophila tropicalis TaxID=46794 RepID=UPI0035AB7326